MWQWPHQQLVKGVKGLCSWHVCGFCFLRCIAALCWCNDLITVYCCFRIQAWNLHSPQPPEKADPVIDVSKSDSILLYKPFISSRFIFLHPASHSKLGLQIIFIWNHQMATKSFQNILPKTLICCKFTSDYMQIWQQVWIQLMSYISGQGQNCHRDTKTFFLHITEHFHYCIMYKSMNMFEERCLVV